MIPLKFTREEASELFASLAATEPGFSPANAVAAADNLNLLHPFVSALDKGKTAFHRETRRIEKDVRYNLISRHVADERLEKLADELIAKTEEEVELKLHPLKLSDEELSSAKIKPANLAVLRRRLLEPKQG